MLILLAFVAVVALVAVEAFPVKAPTKVVDVTEDSPAIVVAELPKDIEVLPTVIELLANLALVTPLFLMLIVFAAEPL